MSDPGLLTIDPYPGGVERWTFIHSQDHNRLAAAANVAFPSAELQFRIMDPLPADIDGWLLDHQKDHDDLNGLLGLIGSDLQTVDFKDQKQRDAWVQINEQEHAAIASVLGI